VGDEASFFDFKEAVLVPIDALDTYYPVEEVPDFWDVVGRNTEPPSSSPISTMPCATINRDTDNT
jgi:hypothetical protein